MIVEGNLILEITLKTPPTDEPPSYAQEVASLKVELDSELAFGIFTEALNRSRGIGVTSPTGVRMVGRAGGGDVSETPNVSSMPDTTAALEWALLELRHAEEGVATTRDAKAWDHYMASCRHLRELIRLACEEINRGV